MLKTNKQKKQEFVNLLCNVLDGLDEFPKPLKMIAKTAAKQIDENKIDEILDGTLDFLAEAFTKIEGIRKDETPQLELVENKKQLRA